MHITRCLATVLAMVVVSSAAAQKAAPAVPRFEPDPLWAQALPNRWVTGQVGGVAVDSHDNWATRSVGALACSWFVHHHNRHGRVRCNLDCSRADQ